MLQVTPTFRKPRAYAMVKPPWLAGANPENTMLSGIRFI